MRTPAILALALALGSAFAADSPAGEVKGSAAAHSQASAEAGLAKAQIALPAGLTGGSLYLGAYADKPALSGTAPVVVFLHGSSGINAKLGFDRWQQMLAEAGIASIIFDSMQLEQRITYSSPVDKAVYEKIHALRASEIEIVLAALQGQDWADKDKLFLAGTSEGAVAVARYDGDAFLGKLIYSWSCEDNYFVEAHRTSLKPTPVLNINSARDKYFSADNAYLGNDKATGNCAAAYGKEADFAEVLLIPDAPHTLINLPAAQSATLGFIGKLLK